jgi:hypothetical protein
MNRKLIVTNSSGEVVRIENNYDPSNFVPASIGGGTPLIVDSSVGIPTVNITETTVDTDGEGFPTGTSTTILTPVSISPATEQILTGSIVGQFKIGEQMVQSQFIPVLVNGLALFGSTAAEYLPTIGTIGASGADLGNRALQFKGSYLDTNTKAAGVRLPSFSTTSFPYFTISGFLYFQAEPSNNYDPILVTRSADGVNNSTNDSFRLEYDTSSDQLQFHYSTASYASSGYENIINVCPANGVTLNQWHQFAIAYSNQGGSAAISSYWNGNRHARATGLSGNIRNSTAAFMVGSGVSGDKPLKGWLEHLMISAGGVSLALREFTHGLTASVSTNQYAGDYTVYAMSMNGPLGSSLFPVTNANRVISTHTWTERTNARIGAGNIVREELAVGGTSGMFVGVCGGHAVSGGSAGYLFGYDSGACMVVTAVQELNGVTAARQIKQALSDFSAQYLLGSTTMNGVSGGSGDFQRLLSVGQVGFCGDRFSFLPIDSNVSALKTLYDDITINGRTANYSIEDYNGTIYTFGTAGVKALYQDVVEYRSTAQTVFGSVKTAISAQTSLENVRKVGGVSYEGTVLRIAPAIADNGFLLLSGKAKASKTTNFPEQQNKPKGKNQPELGDPFFIDEF